jgi:hypothetical protein
MKTVKCKIANEIDVSEYLRKYNSILRISFNRLKDSVSQPDIKKEVNKKFEGLNSFIIQNAIVQAQGILNSWKSRKADFEKRNPGKQMKPPVFGGRKNLVRYLKKQISKDEFRKFRLMPMTIAGETRHRGNRLFNLDIANCMVAFKPKKGILIPAKFAASKKQKAELLKVQELCLQNRFSVAISLDNEHISFCYDELKLFEDEYRFNGLKKNRILGID